MTALSQESIFAPDFDVDEGEQVFVHVAFDQSEAAPSGPSDFVPKIGPVMRPAEYQQTLAQNMMTPGCQLTYLWYVRWSVCSIS